MKTTEVKKINPYVIPGIPGIMGIDDAVSQVWGVDTQMLRLKTRKREIVEPRQVAIWWRIRNTNDSLKNIGRYYGLDHCTAMYSRDQVNNLIQVDVIYRDKVNEVIKIMKTKKLIG